ncbi:MAG TPA: IS66 family insertion sequence element accessory protein TnpB [Lachnospiraceae bacterium]|nr:IS66 family insertion sequence element accessory protein TnpB [Lachnospiraceae bacterium]
MDQTTHEVRLEQWKEVVLRCQKRPDGMSARQWLKDNDVREKKYYYWLRRIRKSAYEQSVQSGSLPAVRQDSGVAFAEFPVPAQDKEGSGSADGAFHPSAVIRSASLTVSIANDVSDGLLSRLLEEMRHA